MSLFPEVMGTVIDKVKANASYSERVNADTPIQISTMTDDGMNQLDCAYISVLEEYKGTQKSGHILHTLHILHMSNHLMCYSSQIG